MSELESSQPLGVAGKAPKRIVWYIKPFRITAKFGTCVFCKKDVVGKEVAWWKEGHLTKDGTLIVGRDAIGYSGVVICNECTGKAYVVLKHDYDDKYDMDECEPIRVGVDEKIIVEIAEEEKGFLRDSQFIEIQKLSDIVIQSRRR